MFNSSTDMPLSSFKVLDLTIARAGPVAVRLLSDWGADVIRVEPPPVHDQGSVTGRRRGSDEQNLHRNKRSLCVDLKSPEGQEILKRLVEKCDVVVENFRTEVKKRLGVSYEDLVKINPRIILASISGYGQDGPYAKLPAVDQVIQGMTGLSSITGAPGGGPMRVGVAIADTSAGMFLGQGILLALLHRERTGKGQWVHTSLLEGMISKLDFQATRYTVDGHIPEQQGNSHPTASAMNTYQAKDGPVNIAASTEKMWQSLCRILDATSLRDHPDFQGVAARVACRPKVDAALNELVQGFTVDELVSRLTQVGVPCGPIYRMDEVFRDDQVKHLQMIRTATHKELGDLNLIRSPLNFSGFTPQNTFDRAAPDAGEHSVELLNELGYTESAINEFRTKGVVA